MGCSVRFAGNPGRTKERRIERFAGQHAPRAAKATEKPLRVEAEGGGKMIDDKKSTDPGLSAAERKALRGHEAQEAIADHESAQKAFNENRERLREERMVREVAEGPMVAPTPELPDDTPIERVLFSTRIQNALRAADLKTVGEVREMSNETLISLPDLGKGSLAALRGKLGLPSTDGVRPASKKPA
jgi:DNA-directed RNA polymerase alpha subunit